MIDRKQTSLSPLNLTAAFLLFSCRDDGHSRETHDFSPRRRKAFHCFHLWYTGTHSSRNLLRPDVRRQPARSDDAGRSVNPTGYHTTRLRMRAVRWRGPVSVTATSDHDGTEVQHLFNLGLRLRRGPASRYDDLRVLGDPKPRANRGRCVGQKNRRRGVEAFSYLRTLKAHRSQSIHCDEQLQLGG